MKPTNWKPGDWCFFDCKLAMVKEVGPNGAVTHVTDGFVETSSCDFRDRIFPLDIHGKRVSDEYADAYARILGEAGSMSLNVPDIRRYIRRWIVSAWVKCMDHRTDDAAVAVSYEKLSHFGREARTNIRTLKQQEVGGVRLFTRDK